MNPDNYSPVDTHALPGTYALDSHAASVSPRTRTIIAIVTLVLHLLLLFVLALLNPPIALTPPKASRAKTAELIIASSKPTPKPEIKSPDPAPEPTPKTAPPETLTLAARTARTGHFGMPTAGPDIQDPAVTPPTQESTSQTSAHQETPINPDSAAPSTQPPISPSITHAITHAITQEKSPELEEPTALSRSELPKPAIKHASLEKMHPSQTSAPQEQLIQTPRPVPAKTQQQKKLPSLAQLAQGFLDALEENPGDSSITIHGDKNKKPTAEQIKWERYVEKLSWHIQKSMKIHSKKHPRLTLARGENPIAHIYLALHKNGSIKDVRLVSSSGIPSLDEFYLFAFKDAGSSFPPIPSYLSQDNFFITYAIDFIKEIPR